MNQLFLAGELAADFIEALLCYHFVNLFVPQKIKGGIRFIILSVILLITMQTAEHFNIFPLITTLWFVFYICMTSVLVFQVDTFYSVSLVSFYILCAYIIDFFCLSAMGVLGKNQQFAQMVISQLSLWRCAYLAVNKLLLCLFYLLVKRALKKELFFNASMIFTVSFLGLCGVGFLSWLTIQETSVHALFSWSMCIVLLFVFYFTLLFYTNYRKEKEISSILQLKDQMVRREYELVSGQQKQQQEMSHDLKNHLLVLSNMMEEGKYEDAKAYIARLGEPINRLSGEIWTGNATLDILLSHFKGQGEQLGIRFTIQADAMNLTGMEDQDICCLFANLLDNALEAAGKVPQQKRWVQVKLRKINEMLFFIISNSMSEKPVKQGEALISSKKETGMHGLGIRSAARSVKKYGGILDYEYDTETFTATVTFLEGLQPSDNR